jgi:hypothetical protein
MFSAAPLMECPEGIAGNKNKCGQWDCREIAQVLADNTGN